MENSVICYPSIRTDLHLEDQLNIRHEKSPTSSPCNASPDSLLAQMNVKDCGDKTSSAYNECDLDNGPHQSDDMVPTSSSPVFSSPIPVTPPDTTSEGNCSVENPESSSPEPQTTFSIKVYGLPLRDKTTASAILKYSAQPCGASDCYSTASKRTKNDADRPSSRLPFPRSKVYRDRCLSMRSSALKLNAPYVEYDQRDGSNEVGSIPSSASRLSFPSPIQSSFHGRLTELLLAVQRERKQAEFRLRLDSDREENARIENPSHEACDVVSTQGSISRPNSTSDLRTLKVGSDHTSQEDAFLPALSVSVNHSSGRSSFESGYTTSSDSESPEISASALVLHSVFSISSPVSDLSYASLHSQRLSASPDYLSYFPSPAGINEDGCTIQSESMKHSIGQLQTIVPAAYIEARHSAMAESTRSVTDSSPEVNPVTVLPKDKDAPVPSTHTRSIQPVKRRLSRPLSLESRQSQEHGRITHEYLAPERNAVMCREEKRRRISYRESRFFRRKQSDAISDNHNGQREGEENILIPQKRLYAHHPASLRRAESLRSQASIQQNEKGEKAAKKTKKFAGSSESTLRLPSCSTPTAPTTPVVPTSAFPTPDDAYVPTEPATPAPRLRHRGVSPAPLSPLPLPLPIVAPPSFDLIPRAPLSKEDAAEARINILLEKERHEREADGLHQLVGVCPAKSEQHHEDISKDEACETACDHGDDGCDELEESADVDLCDPTNSSVKDESNGEGGADHGTDKFKPKVTSSNAKSVIRIGIEDNFRREVIEWILDVLPPVTPLGVRFYKHLHEQLDTSEETRFHAAYMFIRYFVRIGSSTPSSPSAGIKTSSSFRQGEEAVNWDTAVGCLALSVKFHRDVLFPLYAIPAHEFMSLAPHEMSFENLEAAQRDILEAFSFCIGSVTPGSFMQELWLALPSLRALLGFDNGWAIAQEEAWAALLDALLEPDILRFPISLLTASALIDGIIESLIQKYKAEDCRKAVRNANSHLTSSPKRRAVKAAQGVLLDLQEVLGYTEAFLKRSRASSCSLLPDKTDISAIISSMKRINFCFYGGLSTVCFCLILALELKESPPPELVSNAYDAHAS
ncbi:hypothetical protein AcV7_005415 [Taiwanofungus camphoratus]|nr:hypothetical protein AcV7_005415 [Antrodia cinnamomea]